MMMISVEDGRTFGPVPAFLRFPVFPRILEHHLARGAILLLFEPGWLPWGGAQFSSLALGLFQSL